MARFRLPLLSVSVAALVVGCEAELRAATVPPVLSVTCADAVEGQPIPCRVTKSKVATSYSQVRVRTSDGKAKAGVDYVGQNTVLTLGNRELVKGFTIQTLPNATVDGMRGLGVTITATRFATIGIATSLPSVLDDDVAAPIPIPPAPVDDTKALSLEGGPAIPSEFAPETTIYPSYQPGPQPPDEPVGAFRFICAAGQSLADDPLVYPGQPGKSHRHRFYGNLGANAYSTSQSLRTTGRTTCGDPQANPANRSAYWIADMFDGKGNMVVPDFNQLYYKGNPKDSAACKANSDGSPNKWGITICVSIPNGIRFIFGYNTATGEAAQYPWRFNCDAVGGTDDVNMAKAAAVCPVGSLIFARQQAPTCWNGHDLDSPDHRSHVVYMQDTHLGYFACPAGHSFAIAALSLAVAYRIAEGDEPTKWRFSSDLMHLELPAGSTMHADYWEAWDPVIKKIWTDNCINRMLNCVGGALGNGYSIHGAETPYYVINGVSTPLWQNPHHLEPIPQ
jgi:hypothetical protein